MTCYPGFFNAALVEQAGHHAGTEGKGIDPFSRFIRRSRIGQPVAGHIDDDHAIRRPERLRQLVEDIHRLQVAVQQHQTGFAGLFCVENMDGNTRRYRKEFHIA